MSPKPNKTHPQVSSGPRSPDSPDSHVLRPILALNPKTGIVEVISGAARAIIRRSDSSFRYSENASLEHANLDGKRYTDYRVSSAWCFYTCSCSVSHMNKMGMTERNLNRCMV